MTFYLFSKTVNLFLFLVFLLLAAPVWAFDIKGLQPLSPYGVFSTFSAESLRQGTIGFGVTAEKSFDPNFYRIIGQFAVGFHDRLEVNLTLPYVLGYGHNLYGTEDLNAGVKHRILDEGDYSPAVAYILTASIPTGREEFSTDGSFGAGLILTKKIGPFKGHANLLFSNPYKNDMQKEYLFNLGAEFAVRQYAKILAEIIGRKNYNNNTIDLLEWRIGYRIATIENFYTSFGAGFNIKNRTPECRLLLSLSYQLPVGRTGSSTSTDR